MKTFRFPGGSKNNSYDKEKEELIERLIIHLNNMGISYVDWNVDSFDEKATNKDEIVNNVAEGIKDNNIVWIRLHDDKNSNHTVEALKEIIDLLKEKGYTLRAWDINCHIYHFS